MIQDFTLRFEDRLDDPPGGFCLPGEHLVRDIGINIEKGIPRMLLPVQGVGPGGDRLCLERLEGPVGMDLLREDAREIPFERNLAHHPPRSGNADRRPA